MKRTRNNYTPEEKVSILRKHLVENIPVSDICDEYKLNPNVFYRWQKEFFENGSAAFKKPGQKKEQAQANKDKQRIEQLEKKLVQKNEVVSELMEAHIQLKKNLGEI